MSDEEFVVRHLRENRALQNTQEGKKYLHQVMKYCWGRATGAAVSPLASISLSTFAFTDSESDDDFEILHLESTLWSTQIIARPLLLRL